MSPDPSLLLENQLCFALYAASRAFTRAYQPHLAKLGITYPQYLVMLVLWEQDGISVQALGDRLLLDSGTLSPLLKRLVALGLVAKARSDEDERVVVIRLTPKGRRLREKAAEVPAALACAIPLPAEDFRRLRSDVRRLLDLIRSQPSLTTSRKEAP